MNITAIRVYSPTLAIPSDVLETPHLDLVVQDFDNGAPYIIKNATGLGPPDLIDAKHSHSVQANFGAIQPRIIDLLITLNPNNNLNKSISELRSDLYKIIHTGVQRTVDVRFFDKYTIGEAEGGSSIARTTGVITKVDANFFAKESEVLLTIRCDEPLIKGMSKVDGYDERIVNEDAPDEIIFHDNISDAPHGIEINVLWPTNVEGEPINFRFELISYHADGTSSFFSLPLSVTSVQSGGLYLSSNYNELSLRREITSGISAGSVQSAVKLIEDGSEWPYVVPGINHFELVDSYKFTYIEMLHTPTFWGV